jgi:hypothetical protein
MAGLKHPVTPDGRYFVARGKLWRMSDPNLDPQERSRLVNGMMDAHRSVKQAKSAGDRGAEADAHRLVDRAKRGPGERGPVWKDDLSDFNKQAVKNSPYAGWYAAGSAYDFASTFIAGRAVPTQHAEAAYRFVPDPR